MLPASIFSLLSCFLVTSETHPSWKGNSGRLNRCGTCGQNGYRALVPALRHHWPDLSDEPVLARAGNKALSWTLGLDWYLNPYAKIMFNWIRFKGTNTPIDPIGGDTKGDALATRLHLDF